MFPGIQLNPIPNLTLLSHMTSHSNIPEKDSWKHPRYSKSSIPPEAESLVTSAAIRQQPKDK